MHGRAARKLKVLVELQAGDVGVLVALEGPLQASAPADWLVCMTLLGLFCGAVSKAASANTVAAAIIPRQARGPAVGLQC